MNTFIPTMPAPSFNVNVTPYDGDSELLDFFISQVKEIATINKWSDKQTLTFARSKLMGPALKFVIQKSQYQPISSSNGLFLELREQFQIANPCKAIADFNSLSMLPTETIRNLSHRLDILAPKAHIKIKDTSALDAIKFNKFIAIIPSEFRKHILQQEINSYQDAVKKASLLQECEVQNEVISHASTSSTNPYQELKDEIATLKHSLNFASSQNTSHKTNEREFDSHKDHYHRKFNNYHHNRPYKSKHNQNYKFKSNQPYHKKHYRSNNINGSSNNNNAAQSSKTHNSTPSFNSNDIKCQFCGLLGHTCQFCPCFKYYFSPKFDFRSSATPAFPPPLTSHQAPATHHVTVQNAEKSASSLTSSSKLNPNAEIYVYPTPISNAFTQHDPILKDSKYTQTKNENVSSSAQTEFHKQNFPNTFDQVIANVQNCGPILPLINIQLAKSNTPVLLDTGSSVSIISSVFFQLIKQQVKVKYLSRQVKISTVNSIVSFSSCVELSFKIRANFFKHPFYVIAMSEDPSFNLILGYDFLRKHHVHIDSSYTKCKIHGEEIPFINAEPSESMSDVNSINIQNTHVQYDSKDPIIELNVNISNKITILPGEQIYIKVHTPYVDSNDTKFVFTAKSVKNLLIHDAMYEFDLQDSTIQHITFHIFVENKSNSPIFLHKNQPIGFFTPVDDFKTPFTNSTHNCTSNQQSENINVIVPSDEILSLRKQEFHISNFNLSHLSCEQRHCISKILCNNATAFSMSLKTLGHTDLVKPNLKFTSDSPIKCLPFPIPQALQEEAKKQLQELVEAGIIEKNLSNWACPMILVKKKTTESNSKQTYRLALDLRLINTIIEGSSYPLPKIQDLISNIAKYKFFTSLDMPQAYHQINLPKEFQDQLSFATPWATYRYVRLVFGLKTASQYFQSMADLIIDEAAIDGIHAYQDDFMLGSTTFEETCSKLDSLLKIFSKHNLTLNPKKCSFHKSSIQYLGFEISQSTIAPISSNIQKINSFPAPKSKRHLKRFLGVCGFYRHLIPAYAKLTDPLVKLSSPKSPFKWETVHQDAFSNLQKIFFNKPFLVQPDFSKEFYLNTDASSFAISAILMQKSGDNFLPISYFSKTLKDSEKRYEAIKLELMAIVKGVTAFKYYLCGRHFYILSDSKPLKHYDKISSPANVTTRWLLTLAEYEYTFIHVPGKENVLADYFSRTPFPDTDNLITDPSIIQSSNVLPVTSEENVNSIQNSAAPLTDALLEISTNTILIAQKEDPVLSKVYQDLCNNKDSPHTKYFSIDTASKLLLYLKDPIDNEAPIPKIALPKSLRAKALRIAHVSHLGISKTYQALAEKFFWQGIYADTTNFVKSCSRCMTAKSHRIPQAPLQNNPLPTHPGDFISMDLVGPFTNGQHILTCIDHFSRHLQMYPIATISSQNIVQALFKYITTHGRPSMILSDLGKQFTSEIFNLFARRFGIRLINSSPAHPQANAISERINQSIKSTIIALQEDGYNFTNSLSIHQMMYNSAIHSSTKFSPNNIHFGRKISTLYDTFIPSQHTLQVDSNITFFNLMQDLEQIYKKVFDNLQLAQQLQNKTQHQKAKLRIINIGDIVYIRSMHTFKKRYTGPYTVVQKSGPVNVIVQRSDFPTARKFKIHIDRLWVSPPRRQHLIPDDVLNPQLQSACPVPVSGSNPHQYPLQSACPVPVSGSNPHQYPLQSAVPVPVHSSPLSSPRVPPVIDFSTSSLDYSIHSMNSPENNCKKYSFRPLPHRINR